MPKTTRSTTPEIIKIPDKLFKGLPHNCKGYKLMSNGQNIEPGYKPDYVLRNDNSYIILESECQTNRKAYVGGLMKAAHFLQGKRKGIKVYMVVRQKNTTAKAIAAHLKIYFHWVQNLTNLKEVYVIETHHYYQHESPLIILEKAFLSFAYKVE